MKRFRLMAFLTCCVFLLSSCLLPARGLPAQATTNPNAIFTQAVKTVIAQMTATVSPAGGEGQSAGKTPVSTPAVEASTPLAVTATAAAQDTQAVPTATQPAATATVQAQAPTLAASDPRVELGTPTFQDTFEDSKNWAFSPDAHSNMVVKDGKVVMTAYNRDYFNSWTLTWPKLTDFYLELTGSSGTCAGLDRYGLVFRAPDASRGYLVGLSCDARYALWYWDGTQEVYLVNWTSSSYILKGAGQVNRLGVKARGDRITIFINGNQVSDLHDNTYSQGFYGLFIGAVETANYTANVTEVDYWELK